jgi:hypothetical protein
MSFVHSGCSRCARNGVLAVGHVVDNTANSIRRRRLAPGRDNGQGLYGRAYVKILLYRNPHLTNVYVHRYYAMYDFASLGGANPVAGAAALCR